MPGVPCTTETEHLCPVVPLTGGQHAACWCPWPCSVEPLISGKVGMSAVDFLSACRPPKKQQEWHITCSQFAGA